MRITVEPGSRDDLVVNLEGVGPLTRNETETLCRRLLTALERINRRTSPNATCTCPYVPNAEDPSYSHQEHDHCPLRTTTDEIP